MVKRSNKSDRPVACYTMHQIVLSQAIANTGGPDCWRVIDGGTITIDFCTHCLVYKLFFNNYIKLTSLTNAMRKSTLVEPLSLSLLPLTRLTATVD